MLNLSNILSLSRAIFALAFLQESIWLRLLAIGLAMVSDFFDGFLARRQGNSTQIGAILDPIMDKFFVLFVAGVLFVEGSLPALGLLALFSRDIALCLFGLFLLIVGGWKGYVCRAIWWGKLTTVAQFIFLIGLTVGWFFPLWSYWIFVAMGGLALIELVIRYYKSD